MKEMKVFKEVRTGAISDGPQLRYAYTYCAPSFPLPANGRPAAQVPFLRLPSDDRQPRSTPEKAWWSVSTLSSLHLKTVMMQEKPCGKLQKAFRFTVAPI